MSQDLADFRRRISLLIMAEIDAAGGKEARKTELNNMLNSGRWDKFRMVSSDSMIMKMIDAELMQEAHESWLSSHNFTDVE